MYRALTLVCAIGMALSCGAGSPGAGAQETGAETASQAGRAKNGEGKTSPRLDSSPAPGGIYCGSSGDSYEHMVKCWLYSKRIDDNTDQYTIDNPVVGNGAENSGVAYPISIVPGDSIEISATGCVNAGGFGLTTKPYVGGDGDGYYFGTITIGNAYAPQLIWTDGGPTDDNPTPFPAYEPVEITPMYMVSGNPRGPILATGSDSALLYLGYKDTDGDYENNGYYDMDSGDNGVCSDRKAAEVVITVTHGTPQPITNIAPRVYDAIPNRLTEVDGNGLMFLPIWGWQFYDYPISDPRANFERMMFSYPTSQTTSTDRPTNPLKKSLLHDLGAVAGLCKGFFDTFQSGHTNWLDTTYSGMIYYTDHEWADDDENLRLIPPTDCKLMPCLDASPPGVTPNNDTQSTPSGNPRAIGIEWDWAELGTTLTGDVYWDQYQYYHDKPDLMTEWLGGRPSVVLGLLGLDEVHDYGSELHPAHGFAIDMSCSAGTQQWMFFVRNWGDEGECSELDHQLQTERYHVVLDLPAPEGLPEGSGPTVSAENYRGAMGPADPGAPRNVGVLPTVTTHVTPDGHVQVEAALLPGPQHSVAYGSLTVTWSKPPTNYQQPPGCVSSMSVPPLPLARTNDGNGDLNALRAAAAGFNDSEINALEDSDPETDDDNRGVYATLTEEQRDRYRELIDSVVDTDVLANAPIPGSLVTTPASAPDAGAELVSTYSSLQATRVQARVSALCAVESGHIPDVPDSCVGEPPITVLSLSGGVVGNNGWYKTSPAVTLTPYDASGSGIDHVEYSTDGTVWLRYNGPFALPQGDVTLSYRSVAIDGTVEEIRKREFKVDSAPPISTVSTTVTSTGLDIEFSIVDPQPGSGVVGLHYRSTAPGSNAAGFVAGSHGVIHLDTQCEAVDVWAEDVAGNLESLHQLRDRTPPTLTISPNRFCEWPPNGDRVDFGLGANVDAVAVDACDPSPRISIEGITSNEATTEGDFSFDSTQFCVRRARYGTGKGRVYSVKVSATDYSGNVSASTLTVDVPHDQRGPACQGGGFVGPNEPCGQPQLP